MSPSTPAKAKARVPLQPNPFANSAVQSAWGDVPADVSGIHDAPFRTIQRALKQIQMGGDGTSIVVTGEPGSGKTHLLARLRSRLGAESQAVPENNAVANSVYIYIRCNASAVTLWRHLRFSLASDLLKSGSLDPLLERRSDALDRLENLNLARVLRSLRDGRHVHLAAAWLRGESLTEADSSALEIKIDPEDEEGNREWDAKRATHALLSFLHPSPVVLCFDQVEGLETYHGEQAGFHAFGQLISELHSRHNHLLLLSCVVSDYQQRFEQSLLQSDKDRVFQYVQNLRPIEWAQAEAIVKARLDAAPALAAERRGHAGDIWWPLDPEPLRPLFAATGLCLPRKLLQACKQQFDECMSDELPPAELRRPMSVAEFLQEQYEIYLAEGRRAVAAEGADKILGESLPWLLENSGYTVLGPRAESPMQANVVYRTPSGDTALVFCFRRGNAFTNTLKRVDNGSWNSRVAVKILSDPGIQPKEGSVASKVLSSLKQRGARQIYPVPEALAALHAIRNLITSARSGELTLDGQQISEQQVTEWVLANLAPQLEQLKADLFGSSTDDRILPKLSTLLSEKKVLALDAAARELSLPEDEVAACARRHPMHFGLLEGPPLVLFEAVEGPLPETLHA